MTNREVGIYKIVNVNNQKIYVGSSINIEKRKCDHFINLKNNKHPNIHLQRSYNKCGENNLKFEIIEKCSIDNIIEKEQYYIDILNPEYNICKKAYSKLGVTTSNETRIKMSNSQKGRKHKEESKIKIGLAHKGHKHSKEFGLNISNRQKKAILQFDKNMNFIKEWETISEAMLKYKNVSAVLRGKRKSCGGYIWKYKNKTT